MKGPQGSSDVNKLPGGSMLWRTHTSNHTWPEIRRDYPLNLSILVSGGKETNKDSLSNGE